MIEAKENIFRDNLGFSDFFKKYTPSFDIDGILIDSVKYVTERFNLDYGTNYLPTDMRVFAIVTRWLADLGYSKEHSDKEELRYWYTTELMGAPLRPGIYDFLSKLDSQGIPISIVSSRPKELREPTIKWLKEKLPFLDEERIFIQQGSEMKPHIYKTFIIQQFLKEFASIVHFEDMLNHAETILANTDGRCKLVLLSNMPLYIKNNFRIFKIEGRDSFSLPSFEQVDSLF